MRGARTFFFSLPSSLCSPLTRLPLDVQSQVAAAKKAQPVPIRLHVRGTVTGHRRSKRNTHFQTVLMNVEGVNTKEATSFYLGKRVAYVYKVSSPTCHHLRLRSLTLRQAKTARKTSAGKPTKFRVVWGKIVKPHGTSGAVQAKFSTNLPPQSYGQDVRVFMYPSNI